MQCSSACINCMVAGQYRKIANCKDESIKKQYMLEVCRIISSMDESETTAHLTYLFSNLYNDTFHPTTNKFVDINHDFNEFVLSLTHNLEDKINMSEDPLQTSIIYSRIGNYIDYGAMNSVSKDEFLELFNVTTPLDTNTYTQFKDDLNKASTLLLCADNCGEIVLDKLLLKTIHKLYPNITLKCMVKGDYALNDATLIDATQIGLEDVCEVVSTGNDMVGCDTKYLSKDALEALREADIVISKGQANFETLLGTGYNTYYSFLCKCEYFANRFGVKKFTGMFIRELDNL